MSARGLFRDCPAILGITLSGLLAVLAPLPAAAAADSFEELNRAWTGCVAKQASPERRIVDCSKLIASPRTRDEQRAQAFTARAFARLQKDDRAGAFTDLDESIRLHPTATAHSYRGSMLISRKEFERAIADFSRAIELNPKGAEFYRMRAHVRSQLKDYMGTAADMTSAIEIDPNPKRDYALRGMAYEDAGDKQKAVADYERALEADPDSQLLRASIHQLGGTIPASAALPPGDCSAEKISNEKRAAACATLIDSGKVTGWTLRTAYCNRGAVMTDMGEYDAVVADSNKLLGFDQNAACGYLNRGRALYYKNDVDKAIADYNQTIKLDPNFHEAYANRGTAYHSREDYARAIADYDIAIRLEPKDPMYHSDRGNSRFLMGDYNRAIADLSRAIELEPDNATTFIRRGNAFLEIREFARAESDFNRVLELSPGNMSARSGLAHIKERQSGSAPNGKARPNETGFERFQRTLRSE
jgi:tetratricopeptide (TPR) repeat protein